MQGQPKQALQRQTQQKPSWIQELRRQATLPVALTDKQHNTALGLLTAACT
jgi:hypothetical protein